MRIRCALRRPFSISIFSLRVTKKYLFCRFDIFSWSLQIFGILTFDFSRPKFSFWLSILCFRPTEKKKSRPMTKKIETQFSTIFEKSWLKILNRVLPRISRKSDFSENSALFFRNAAHFTFFLKTNNFFEKPTFLIRNHDYKNTTFHHLLNTFGLFLKPKSAFTEKFLEIFVVNLHVWTKLSGEHDALY